MSGDGKIKLKEASRLTVTTIVDNYTDIFLTDSEHVKRAAQVKDGKRKKPLLAEHGISLLIEIEGNGEKHTLMMDFGITDISVPHNMEVLEIDPNDIDTFIISHGHHDHVGAVEKILKSVNQSKDVYIHPAAFLDSRFRLAQDGSEIPIPSLNRNRIESSGLPIKEITKPTELANGYLYTLTDIPRLTGFEVGMPTAKYRLDGKLFKDNITDDQGFVVNIRDKGLVILTGCGHAGIINTILYARDLTGIDIVYGVMGGMHLAGPVFEPIIGKTVEEMKKFNPRVIVPTHCTGWKAQEAFRNTFPDAFVLNAVGTKIIF